MNPHPPPLAALRTFAVAARLLSFKLAASELHVTPGAVSQQIKSLEDQLGGPLFLRLTRALRLSERGAAMLPLVQQGLDLLDSAWRQGQVLVTPRPVLLAAPPSFAAHWLVPRLAAFHARHPDIALQLSSSSSTVAHALEPASSGGRARQRGGAAADLVIVFSAQSPTANGGTVDLLLAPAYTPICTPALAQALHTPADLLRQRLIHDDTMLVAGLAGAAAWGWPQWLGAQSLTGPDTAAGLRVSNTVLAIEAALAGQGVALAARALVARQLEAGTLVAPLDATALPGPYRYHLVCRATHTSAAAADIAAVRAWLMSQATAAVSGG
jgi:LysR family transcriptional regulator, glycine cleavage system transcriptional activator